MFISFILDEEILETSNRSSTNRRIPAICWRSRCRDNHRSDRITAEPPIDRKDPILIEKFPVTDESTNKTASEQTKIDLPELFTIASSPWRQASDRSRSRTLDQEPTAGRTSQSRAEPIYQRMKRFPSIDRCREFADGERKGKDKVRVSYVPLFFFPFPFFLPCNSFLLFWGLKKSVPHKDGYFETSPTHNRICQLVPDLVSGCACLQFWAGISWDGRATFFQG